MKWSDKYKRSINCENPKGFSQRAHCQGRKKGLREFRDTIKEHVRYTKLNLPKQATIVETVEPTRHTPVMLLEKIKRRGDSYIVTDSTGKKVLGKHKTKRAAVRQIAAIEASKASRVDEGLRDIGKGLAQGAGVGALALGLAVGTGKTPEPSAAPPPTPNTGQIGQLEDKPNTSATIQTPNDPYNGRFHEIVSMTGKFEGGDFRNGQSHTHADPIHGWRVPTNAGQTQRGLTDKHHEYLKNNGLDANEIFKEGGSISREHADNLRKISMEQSTPRLEGMYDNFHDHPHQVKAILHDMHYNLGHAGLAGFKKMNAAINARDYKTAAKELKDSKYYRQTGNRARTHYQTLLSL